MKYIAHRGLIAGPNKNLENQPDQIKLMLEQGFDCEIDLREIKGQLFLGHDQADTVVDPDFLFAAGLWIHCKNHGALIWCSQHGRRLNYFWHDSDAYTLTSQGFIWAYPGQVTGPGPTVQVMPELADPALNNIDWQSHAICSDWIAEIQAQRPKSLI